MKLDSRPLILSMGGSLGARAINEAVKYLILHRFEKRDCYYLHATGKAGAAMIDDIGKDIDLNANPQIMLREYINDMDRCLAAADLVISRISSSGIPFNFILPLSTETEFPLLCTSQPSDFKIFSVESISVSDGQLCITHGLPTATVAARIGSALFFAPCTFSLPPSFLPPSIIKRPIYRTLSENINLFSVYDTFRKVLIF